MKPSLVLVGCGGMGSALLKGWLTLPECHFKNFWVVAPHREKVEPFLEDPRVQWFLSPDQLPDHPDVIVFAVKPFILEQILSAYQSFQSLFISVAAGKPLSFYPSHQSIVRVMPNIPVNIHQGVIGLLPPPELPEDKMTLLKACFQDLGLCLWLTSDDEIDKLTAISGSGPAYVYYMIEALVKAAESLGFEKKAALSIALTTFRGASNYAHSSNQSPEALRKQVTSPQGTTFEALKVLETGNLYTLINEAVMAAYKRARELTK